MKKIIMSTLAIAMMMTMASCSSSDNDVAENSNENKLQKMTFTAIQENSVGTRTTLGGESGKQVIWEVGDKIGINGHEYALVSGGGTTKGVFSGYEQQQTSVYLAVYPYKNTWNITEDGLRAPNIELPSVQQANAGSFDKNAALMMARITDAESTFEFKNAVALVKVTPKFACSKIELKASDEDVALAGIGTLTWNDGEPYIIIQDNKAYSITLNGTIEKDKTYYIAVPTVTLNEGWSISFTDDNGDVYTRTGSKEIKFTRNTIINLGEFSRTDNKLELTLSQNGNVPASKQVDMGVFTIDGKNYRLIFTKSNLTATGLAQNESDYGDYFAWGATVPWYTSYTTGTDSDGNPTVTPVDWKTNYSSGYVSGTAPTLDNKYTSEKVFDMSDDPARKILEGDWQIPTQAIWDKFNKGCTKKWNFSNNGYEFVNNGQTLFLPAAGFVYEDSFEYVGSRGDYWSGTAHSDTEAYNLYYNSNGVNTNNNYFCERYYGFSVRPVRLVAVD